MTTDVSNNPTDRNEDNLYVGDEIIGCLKNEIINEIGKRKKAHNPLSALGLKITI